MIKFIKKHIDTQSIRTALAFAFIYCLMFNTSVVLHKYNNFQGSYFSALYVLLKQFIYIYIAVFVFFLGLSINKWIFSLGTLLLFITGAIASYYLFCFDTFSHLTLKTFIYNTNIFEVQDQITLKMIIWLIFSLVIWSFGMKHFNPQTPKLFLTRIIAAVCLFLAINNIITPCCNSLADYFPVQYLH